MLTLRLQSCGLNITGVTAYTVLQILDDWRYIAMVIDRLQLCLFLAVTITGTASILINAPHIFEFVDQDEIKRQIMGSSDNGAR